MRFAMPLMLAVTPISSSAENIDFTELTGLGEAAVLGTNVDEPVTGFELLVMQNGNTLYHRTFGNWTQNQVARIDSSTKTFTGAVIMSVAESGEGGFSLDSTLGTFLTEYNRPALRNATIRQAFSHQSGMLGAVFNSDVLTNPDLALREAARRIAEFPVPNNPPGSEFVYGGLSMHAAGAAAEVATGETFVDLFSHRIANPMGLNDTRFAVASQTNPRIAGGMESTAIDASRFMDMLLNGGIDRVHGMRILGESAVEEMLSRQTNDQQAIGFSPQDNSDYGIGVWLDQFQSFGTHVDVLAGGSGGFHMWIDQSQGLVFTFASDLTSFGNVEPLSAHMHQSILRSIAAPEPAITNSWPYHVAYSGSGTPPWNSLDTSKTLVKESTVPQTLTYDNLINTAQGINGIVFEIQNLPEVGNLSSDDFAFQFSPLGAFNAEAHPPASWQLAPEPNAIGVTPGDPTRVLIEWPNGSITNRWLRVTILANENTGLAAPATYYIGHLLGETTGSVEGNFTVSFADITPIRSEVGQTVGASGITDIDKSGTVSFADISAMRGNVGSQLTQISVP